MQLRKRQRTDNVPGSRSNAHISTTQPYPTERHEHMQDDKHHGWKADPWANQAHTP